MTRPITLIRRAGSGHCSSRQRRRRHLKKIKTAARSPSATATLSSRSPTTTISSSLGYAMELCLRIADAVKAELKLPRLDVSPTRDFGQSHPVMARHHRPRMRLDTTTRAPDRCGSPSRTS